MPFNVGPLELVIVLVIALLVIGPKRLPEIANRVGRWVGQARRMARTMKRQLEEELDFDDDDQIAQPKLAPPTVLSSTPDPADPAYDADEPDEHVPYDDDSYSPLHGNEEEGPAADDDVEEKRA